MKISEAHKRRLADPGELARHAARMKIACNRPEFLAKVSGPNSPNWIPDREEVRIRRRVKFLMYGMVKRVLRRTRTSKSLPTERVLGYGASDLRAHLEAGFKDGMSWSNYGRSGWVVDHVVPISAFPINAAPAEVNALANLQPLWWKENDSKGGVRCQKLTGEEL